MCRASDRRMYLRVYEVAGGSICVEMAGVAGMACWWRRRVVAGLAGHAGRAGPRRALAGLLPGTTAAHSMHVVLSRALGHGAGVGPHVPHGGTCRPEEQDPPESIQRCFWDSFGTPRPSVNGRRYSSLLFSSIGYFFRGRPRPEPESSAVSPGPRARLHVGCRSCAVRCHQRCHGDE